MSVGICESWSEPEDNAVGSLRFPVHVVERAPFFSNLVATVSQTGSTVSYTFFSSLKGRRSFHRNLGCDGVHSLVGLMSAPLQWQQRRTPDGEGSQQCSPAAWLPARYKLDIALVTHISSHSFVLSSRPVRELCDSGLFSFSPSTLTSFTSFTVPRFP